MGAFNPYTQPIVDAALARGIKISPVPWMPRNYAMLEYRGHREFICQAQTDQIGTVTFRLLYDKAAALELLRRDGFPVAPFVVVQEAEEALAFLREHRKVVVKPTDKSMGQGITVGIASPDALAAAIEAARGVSAKSRVLVQAHLHGEENRLLVIGKKRVFGVRRVPAHVVGDGKRAVRQLILDWNTDIENKTHHIRFSDALDEALADQGWRRRDVPADGAVIFLNDLSNAHQGGISHDITHLLGIEAEELAVGIATAFDVGLLGIDLITPDLLEDVGRIIEVNPHAGITVHLNPTFGASRDVAGAIVDMLFPETADR